jgi:hypothetical protein
MKENLKRWLRSSPLFGLIQRVRLKVRPPARRSLKYQSNGVTILEIQENVCLVSYWVGSDPGPGPSASLFVYGDEVMRFDCFGGERVHFHLNLTQARYFSGGESARLYFPEGSMQDQVKLAAFDCAGTSSMREG